MTGIGAGVSATTSDPLDVSIAVLPSLPVSGPVAPCRPCSFWAIRVWTFGSATVAVAAGVLLGVNPAGGFSVDGGWPADAVLVPASQISVSPSRVVVIDAAASPDTPEVAGAAGSNTLTAWKPAKLSQTAELTLAPDAHAIVNVAPSVPSATRKNNWYWVLLITVAVTAVNPAGVFSAIAPRRTIHSRMTSPGAVFGGLAMV